MRSKVEQPIIFVPELQPAGQRTLEGTLKFLVTALFFVVVTCLTVVLWYGSGLYLWGHLFTPQYVGKTVSVLVTLGWVAVAAFVVVLVWQQYNLRVFGGKRRRQFPPALTQEELARRLQVSAVTVTKAQRLRITVFQVMEDGQRILCDEDGVCEPLVLEEEAMHVKNGEELKS